MQSKANIVEYYRRSETEKEIRNWTYLRGDANPTLKLPAIIAASHVTRNLTIAYLRDIKR